MFDKLSHQDQVATLEELANAALALYPFGGAPAARLINLSENATFAVEGDATAGAGRSASTAMATTRGRRSPPSLPGRWRCAARAW